MNIFEGEITKSLEKEGWFHIKLPVASGKGIRFLAKSPFDFIAVKNGIPFAIEAKSLAARKPFPITRVTEAQIEALLNFERSGGRAYIAICIRKPHITGYCIPVKSYLSVIDSLTAIKRKSIPPDWMDTDNRFTKLPRYKDETYLWDFNVLLEDINGV